MRRLLLLLASAALCPGIGACGGAGKAGKGESPPTPAAAAAARAARAASESPGGSDENIPAFGHEASPGDRRAVTALVKRYYAAVVAADGRTACSLLSPSVAKGIAEDYGQPPGPPYARGKTCPVVMAKIFKNQPGYPTAFVGTAVTDVRIYRDRGFALLRSKATPSGEIFLEREHGAWTIGVPIGRERPPHRSG